MVFSAKGVAGLDQEGVDLALTVGHVGVEVGRQLLLVLLLALEVFVVDELVAIVAEEFGGRTLHAEADDVLAVLLELGDERRKVGIARDDDEGVDVWLAPGPGPSRSTTRRMSAEFLPVWLRRGISISSIAAS